MRSWAGTFLFVAALFAITGGAQAEKRVALVIGNSAYQNTAPLKNPRSDAEDMSTALKRLGFEVISGYDLDDRGMSQRVRDFARSVEGADTALFFYAGHGLQSKGQNYLVPVNASLKTESDLDFETVSLDLVMKQMQRSARVSLVFLDACRDNPLTRSLRSGSRSTAVGTGLARIEEAAGMMISFSTQPGNVALDGAGRNSPFTKALLQHIDTAGATIGDIMIDVRKQVIAETNERQIPWENSSLTGKFYFRPGAQVAATDPGPAAAAPQTAPSRDLGLGVPEAALDHTFWTSIVDSNDASLYREYLRRFPTGMYVSIAEAKLQALSPRPASPDGGNTKTAMVTGTAEAQRGIESPRQVAEDMQRELKRVGCFSGAIDGAWGPQSRSAIERFNQAAKLDLQAEAPSTQDVTKVKSFAGLVCEQVASEGAGTRRRESTGERPRGEGTTIIPNIHIRIPKIKSPF
jgi:uncharacterized caspase-like protein